ILTIIAAVFAANVCLGQEIKDKAQREGDQSVELQALTLAWENAVMGYRTQNPLYLMSAAQLLIDNPSSELQVKKMQEAELKSTGSKEASEIILDPAKLLEDAKSFAYGDAIVTEMIKEKMKSVSGSRGAVGGPYKLTRRVEANDFNIYSIRFRSNELAEIAVIGDSDTDLDLFVFDANDNIIVSDEDYTDRCYVSWIPKWTGEFKIVVMNRGGVFNRFTILTN
ncbi:MAG: hypothetical protein Q8M23_07440, partial [Bacteroidales bacterium]|nr:hypothetical protein [Bacteroidales bacterium]